MQHSKLSSVFIMIAGCCWACTGIFVRFFNEMGLFSLQITEMRSLCTCILLGGYFLIKDREVFKIKGKDLWLFAGAGIPGMVLFTYANFKTMEYASLSVAAMLLYTAPIFVMIFSVLLFGERLTLRKTFSLAMTFFGCFLVSGLADSETSITTAALFTGLLSGLGYGLYTIFTSRAVSRGYSSKTITLYTFLFAGAGGVFLADFAQVTTAVQHTGGIVLLLVLLHALITTIMPNLLYAEGLKHIEAGTASVLASSQVVMAGVFGFIVFAEVPTIYGILGMASVIGALALLNIKTEDKK